MITNPRIVKIHPNAKVEFVTDHIFKVYAIERYTVKKNSSLIIPMGIRTELPINTYVQYINVSERVYPHEVYIHPAMIYSFQHVASEDYTILKNDSDKDYTIEMGEVLICGIILQAKFKKPKVVSL